MLWLTYRNEPARYQVEYPASWDVEETVEGGVSSTTFITADRSTSISIAVYDRADAVSIDSDLPNVRSRPVRAGEVVGQEYFDTISFSTSTVFSAGGLYYDISMWGKGRNTATYHHLIESFRPIPRVPE